MALGGFLESLASARLAKTAREHPADWIRRIGNLRVLPAEAAATSLGSESGAFPTPSAIPSPYLRKSKNFLRVMTTLTFRDARRNARRGRSLSDWSSRRVRTRDATLLSRPGSVRLPDPSPPAGHYLQLQVVLHRHALPGFLYHATRATHHSPLCLFPRLDKPLRHEPTGFDQECPRAARHVADLEVEQLLGRAKNPFLLGFPLSRANIDQRFQRVLNDRLGQARGV